MYAHFLICNLSRIKNSEVPIKINVWLFYFCVIILGLRNSKLSLSTPLFYNFYLAMHAAVFVSSALESI